MLDLWANSLKDEINSLLLLFTRRNNGLTVAFLCSIVSKLCMIAAFNDLFGVSV